MNAKSPETLNHTPGPWRLSPKSIPQRRPRFYVETALGNAYVAEVEIRSQNPAYSDARLIAEAPAMLEVLRRLTKDFQENGEGEFTSVIELYNLGDTAREARAILARLEVL